MTIIAQCNAFADEDRSDSNLVIVGLGGDLGHNVEQLAYLREAGAAHRVSRQADVMDAVVGHSDEMNRQYVRFAQPRLVLVGPSNPSPRPRTQWQLETHSRCRAKTW